MVKNFGTSPESKYYSVTKDKERIVDIFPKGSRCHLSLIEDATRKLYLKAVILRENHKSASSSLNAAALEKAIYREV